MKLCLFSVSYAGFWGQSTLNVTDFIAQASQLGYDSVMLMGKRPHLSPLDITPEQVASIQKSLGEHQIKCSIIGGYTDFSGTGPAEVPFLELQIHLSYNARLHPSRPGWVIVRLSPSIDYV